MGIDQKLEQLAQSLIEGNHLLVERLTEELLHEGAAPHVILDKGLMPGMDVVGRRFREGEIFLPHVLVSARSMKASMKILDPLLAQSSYKAKGKIMLGTVRGDVHDIGKNLVGIMLRGAGYEVVDVGVGCSAQQFADLCELHKPDVLGLSALLTTTMMHMKVVVETLAINGTLIPVIVGGAPLNERFAREIGAAGYARNAADSVGLVKSVLSGEKL